MAGIYIHIPFCASRCIYCGFYSTTGREKLQDRYVDALVKEFSARRDYLKKETVHTIYIGGGTPSLLSETNLRKISSCLYKQIRQNDIEEFTVECNPDDISPTLAKLLYEVGVTRVSMGAQTFSDTRLAFLHRRHRAEQIPNAIRILRTAGIKNISIDLMFGFPEETLEEWENDINTAISLGVEHISAYSLMYEEGTALYKERECGIVKEIDEETSVQMYDLLIDRLTEAGYDHYEISNFAKPNYRSRHNSSYWDGTHYLGIGAAAHSYDGNTRGWNANDINGYIDWVEGNKSDSIMPMECEILDEDTKYNDMVTTALRTREGINLSDLSSKYYKYIIRNARKRLEDGTLKVEVNHIHLTRKGLYISDDVMSDLIYC